MMPKNNTLKLELDKDDYDAVTLAMKRRLEWDLPEGSSDLHGLIVASICRGWHDLLDRQTNNEDEVANIATLQKKGTNYEGTNHD